MMDLTQGIQYLQRILPPAQSSVGADFLPFIGIIISRLIVAAIMFAFARTVKFIWRKIRYKRRLVCRLKSRKSFGLINGQPFAIKLTDHEGRPYEVNNSPGLVTMELHVLRSDEILRDHIKGQNFKISFDPAEVREVYKYPIDDPVEISKEGGTLTLSPQYIVKNKPISLQVVLENYDEGVLPKIDGEIVEGGKIRLVRMDRPGAVDNFVKAFTFIFLLFFAVLLFLIFLGLQFSYPQSLTAQFITSAFMALLITAIPYAIYYQWLMERGDLGRDFPPSSVRERVSRYMPSIRLIRSERFFWMMLFAAFVLFIFPGVWEIVMWPRLVQFYLFIRGLIGI